MQVGLTLPYGLQLELEGWGEGDQLAASSTTASRASRAHLSGPVVKKTESKSL